MRYYFNTQEQILGDTEYNSQNYKQALVLFKKLNAKEYLNDCNKLYQVKLFNEKK